MFMVSQFGMWKCIYSLICFLNLLTKSKYIWKVLDNVVTIKVPSFAFFFPLWARGWGFIMTYITIIYLILVSVCILRFWTLQHYVGLVLCLTWNFVAVTSYYYLDQRGRFVLQLDVVLSTLLCYKVSLNLMQCNSTNQFSYKSPNKHPWVEFYCWINVICFFLKKTFNCIGIVFLDIGFVIVLDHIKNLGTLIEPFDLSSVDYSPLLILKKQ